jgi:serine/threonine protein kinase
MIRRLKCSVEHLHMAPEIVNKEEYAGPPADIWASGVLLFALMNGKFPFRGDTDRDLYRRINRGTYELHNPLISHNFINFLHRMINTNADERPTAEELL